MFRRLTMLFVVALATSEIASAGVIVGGFYGPRYVGGGGGGYHHSSYYHYSAPSYNYAPPQIVYRRVPVYLIRRKPVVKVVRVVPKCGCDTADGTSTVIETIEPTPSLAPHPAPVN